MPRLLKGIGTYVMPDDVVEEIDLDDECAESYFQDLAARQEAERKEKELNMDEIEINDEDLDFGDDEVDGNKDHGREPPAQRIGPRKIEFITNKDQRRKSFCKRKTTLLKMAMQLAILTGAKVKLEITNESGNSHYYHSEPPVKMRDVRLQVGPSRLSNSGESKNVTTINSFSTAMSSDGASKRSASEVYESSKSNRYAIMAAKVPKRSGSVTVHSCDKSLMSRTDQGTGTKASSSRKHGSRTAAMVCCEVDGCNVWTSVKRGKANRGEKDFFICNLHKHENNL